MYWRSHFGSSTSNLAAHSSCCSDKPGCISSVQSCYCSCILHTPDLGHTLGFTVCFRYLAYPQAAERRGEEVQMVIQNSSMVSIPSYVFWDNLHPEWSWFHEKCWCHLVHYFPWTHRFSLRQGWSFQISGNCWILHVFWVLFGPHVFWALFSLEYARDHVYRIYKKGYSAISY